LNETEEKFRVKIFAGELDLGREHTFIGELELAGISPSPRGIPQIEVSMALDEDGILVVSAVDKGSGKSETLTIDYAAKPLSEEEIARMVREAEEFAAEEEEALRKKAEAVDKFIHLVSGFDGLAADPNWLDGKLSDANKERIKEVIREAKAWVDSAGKQHWQTAEEIDEKREEIQRIIGHTIMAKMHPNKDQEHVHNEL